MVVRTCRSNDRSVIKEGNLLDINWKAFNGHVTIQW
jgi:hypothetical protein